MVCVFKHEIFHFLLYSIEDALNFASKKLFTSDSVPHKKLDMLFWNDLSFAIIVKLRDYCLTKISVELNPIKFFCNNNEIEIIGTLISFPAKWQFFNTKSKEAPMCSSTISRLYKEKLYYFHMTFTFYVIRMFLRTGSQM